MCVSKDRRGRWEARTEETLRTKKRKKERKEGRKRERMGMKGGSRGRVGFTVPWCNIVFHGNCFFAGGNSFLSEIAPVAVPLSSSSYSHFSYRKMGKRNWLSRFSVLSVGPGTNGIHSCRPRTMHCWAEETFSCFFFCWALFIFSLLWGKFFEK